MALDWTKANLIPFADLEAWHMYEPGVSTSRLAKDYSGKGRDLTVPMIDPNPPDLEAEALNGESAWYFNGTSTNPMRWSGSVNLKHIFVLCAAEETTFSVYRGLLSGLALGDILTGNISSNIFFDHGASAYRKSDVSYTASAQAAPMSSQFALVEIVYNAGVPMDGIQVGKQRDLTAPDRLWKGYWKETIAYSQIKNDPERFRILQYFAMRSWLWQKATAAGPDVFPFFVNKSRSSGFDQENYPSAPYSGDPQVMVRGSFKGNYSLPFTNRRQEEYLAAEQFVKTHKMPTHSIYRDYRFLPHRDREGYITSGIREQGSDVAMRFNYSFDFSELV